MEIMLLEAVSGFPLKSKSSTKLCPEKIIGFHVSGTIQDQAPRKDIVYALNESFLFQQGIKDLCYHGSFR